MLHVFTELKPHVNATETMFLNNKLRSTKSPSPVTKVSQYGLK